MKEELFIYVDMDGVLANFDKEINAVERFAKEEGFFKKLKPISSNVAFINDLISNGFNVCVLSASPNKSADNDKIEWLKRYIPNLKKYIIIRNGENKADFVKTNGVNVLFDDWGKNCRDFEDKGFKAYQVKKYKTIRKLFKDLGI